MPWVLVIQGSSRLLVQKCVWLAGCCVVCTQLKIVSLKVRLEIQNQIQGESESECECECQYQKTKISGKLIKK